ncbi:MAG TPA: hypothetical protein VGO18_01550, partial [Steroidobacteraceae bacterium]|nr:hypothetical protein [Steroidobacteraceae bacterium]
MISTHFTGAKTHTSAKYAMCGAPGTRRVYLGHPPIYADGFFCDAVSIARDYLHNATALSRSNGNLCMTLC